MLTILQARLSFERRALVLKSEKMKHSIILLCLFILATFTNLLYAQTNKYIDVSNQQILFQDQGEQGLMDFYSHPMSQFNYIRLKADASASNNNVLITGGGALCIGTTDPEDDYKILTGDQNTNDIKLIIHGGYAYNSSSSWETFSDRRLKRNIDPFTKGLDVLKQLNFYEYEYNGLAQTDNSGRRYVGVMAQEIKDILPNTVGNFRSRLRPGQGEVLDLYTFNPQELLYVAMNSIKEVASVTEELEARTQVLESTVVKLTELEQANQDLQQELEQIKTFLGLNAGAATGRVESQQRQNRLLPCVPNPTSGLTELPYELQTSFGKASISVYDLKGRMVEQFDIRQEGKGSVLWNPKDSPSGIYTYTLIVDNELMDSQRVVLK